MSDFSLEQIQQRTELLADQMRDLPGGLLPILHRLQDDLGYVPEQSVPILAKKLGLSRAEVHGVITFYHHFRRTAPGKRTVYVCRAEACQSVGGLQLEEHIKKTLAVDYHDTTSDQEFTLEPIYCLGNCACAPAVMLDEQVVGRVTPQSFDALIEASKS